MPEPKKVPRMTKRQEDELAFIQEKSAELGYGDMTVGVKGGLRSAAEQEREYRAGRSKISGYKGKPGPHQTGEALDVYFTGKDINNKDKYKGLKDDMKRLHGKDYGQIPWDMGHFEFPASPAEEIDAKQKYLFGPSSDVPTPAPTPVPDATRKGKVERLSLRDSIGSGFSSALSMLLPSANAGEIPQDVMVDMAQAGNRKPEMTGPVMEATQLADNTKNKKAQSFEFMKQNPDVVAKMMEDTDIDPDTEEQVMALLSTPEAIDQVKNNSLNEAEQPSLAMQFLDSVSFFMPTIAGAIGGALADGSTGAAVGINEGRKMQATYLDYLSKKEELALKRSKASASKPFQQSQYEDENGQPLIFDPSSGLYRSMNGSIVAPGKVKSRVSKAEEGKNTRFKEAMGFRQSKEATDQRSKAIKAFSSDKEVVAAREAQGLAERALHLLDSNSPFSKSFGERALARLAGEVGVLTEADVTSFSDPRVVEQIKNSILMGSVGELSAGNKKILKEALTSLSKKRKEKVREVGLRTARQYSKATGIHETELQDILINEQPDKKDDKESIMEEIRKLRKELGE